MSEKFGISFDPCDSLTDIFLAMLADRPEIQLARCNTEEFLIDAVSTEIARSGEQEKDGNTALGESMEKELAAWTNLSAGIGGHWREDVRYRRHKDGTFYYLGEESGQYMRLANDGKLTAGQYELARPGIADAVLVPVMTKDMGGYERAVLLAAQLGGTRFLSDLDGMTKYAPPEPAKEKPSVLDQIREAKKNPPVPRKQKDGHGKEDPSL